jgi:signal transduction protein with GAF and PtsI domain
MPEDLIEILRKYERLKALYNVISIIHSTLEPSKALNLIVEEAVRLINASAGSVILVNPANGFLEIESSFGLPSKAKTIKLRIGEGITGWWL